MITGWLDAVEEEIARCLAGGGTLSPAQVGERLGISEGSAISYICLLASEGRLTIERVTLSRGAAGGGCDEVPAQPRP